MSDRYHPTKEKARHAAAAVKAKLPSPHRWKIVVHDIDGTTWFWALYCGPISLRPSISGGYYCMISDNVADCGYGHALVYPEPKQARYATPKGALEAYCRHALARLRPRIETYQEVEAFLQVFLPTKPRTAKKKGVRRDRKA